MVMGQDGGGVGGRGGEDGVSHQPGPERMTAEMTKASRAGAVSKSENRKLKVAESEQMK